VNPSATQAYHRWNPSQLTELKERILYLLLYSDMTEWFNNTRNSFLGNETVQMLHTEPSESFRGNYLLYSQNRRTSGKTFLCGPNHRQITRASVVSGMVARHRNRLADRPAFETQLHLQQRRDYGPLSDCVRFEVFRAVTMKNGVFWVVTPCGSCKNRRFGGTWRLLHQGGKNW
jgi:hypothetical protein